MDLLFVLVLPPPFFLSRDDDGLTRCISLILTSVPYDFKTITTKECLHRDLSSQVEVQIPGIRRQGLNMQFKLRQHTRTFCSALIS